MKRIRQWGGRKNIPYRGHRSDSGTHLITTGMVFLVLGFLLWMFPSVRFSGYFFLMLSALCFLWLILQKWAVISRWGLVCKRIFLVGVAAVSAALLLLEIGVIVEGKGDDPAKPVDAVIVLGAGVNGERPSAALQSRIDRAAVYLKEHPNIPAVLSGGQGSGEAISEAEAMRRALVKQGIQEERLLLENGSTNTAENFRFSKEVLKNNGIDLETGVIGVVSNDFHLFRAKILASREALSVCGIPAELPWWWLEMNYYLREAFASVKTLLFD